MTVLGQSRQDLPFPVCSHFQPTVLEGQRCYSLTIETQLEVITGPEFGLLMILDSGPMTECKHSQLFCGHKNQPKDNIRTRFHKMNLNPSPSGGNKNPTRIYLNTLASFTDFRSGSNVMSSLKKMTGSDSFMALSSARDH